MFSASSRGDCGRMRSIAANSAQHIKSLKAKSPIEKRSGTLYEDINLLTGVARQRGPNVAAQRLPA
jgi:hypothetical protein